MWSKIKCQAAALPPPVLSDHWFLRWSYTVVVRNLMFNLGSDVNLTCSDREWNNTIYVIWKIQHKNCEISFSNITGEKLDSCNDSKSLRNPSRAQSYLHIPNLSAADEGVYKCDFVFFGGEESYKINVAITVPPSLSAWIEHSKDKMVAVCRAEGGKPAANISWTHSRDSQSVETRVSDELITVESRLELDEGTDTQNLSCAVRHPYWQQEQILTPKLRKDYVPFLLILIGVVISVLLIEDVEEVEPYASYVQRVNSIYN
ncbi:cell surface glycoprotein CD200 receptor 1-B [Paralichthys olivaceus]|uniref:cell surface glycoprotein CD200 receptor 1-B n=1 Tax=Paralichthys olivaceus TaxID=8255 RepID=UPI00375221C0